MTFQTVVDALQQGIIKYEPDYVSEFQCNNGFSCNNCIMNSAKAVDDIDCDIYDRQAPINSYISQLKNKYPEYFI